MPIVRRLCTEECTGTLMIEERKERTECVTDLLDFMKIKLQGVVNPTQ